MRTLVALAVSASFLLVGCDSDNTVAAGSSAGGGTDVSAVSPVRGIQRGGTVEPDVAVAISPFRTLDGTGNNLLLLDMNASHSQLGRIMGADYSDLMAAPSGTTRPLARSISNAVAAQPGSRLNGRNASDFLWQWGQFLDHDLDLTEGVSPAEP
ncbi:MAG: peroxidase family protein, partial [Pseudomonadota bacterium]